MVNKKVLALMIAAALTVQSQAGAYVSAAGTEKMSEQTEQTEAQEKGSDVKKQSRPMRLQMVLALRRAGNRRHPEPL